MSFVGLVVAACLPTSVDLARVASTDDLGAIQLGEGTSVLAFTRNGWLNHRLEEIAQVHRIARLPTSEARAVACVGASLDRLVADLGGFLASLRHDPNQWPMEAREQAEPDDVQSAVRSRRLRSKRPSRPSRRPRPAMKTASGSKRCCASWGASFAWPSMPERRAALPLRSQPVTAQACVEPGPLGPSAVSASLAASHVTRVTHVFA